MIKLIYYKAVDNPQEIIERVPEGIIKSIYVVDSDPPETHVFVDDKTTEEEKQVIDSEIMNCHHKTPPERVLVDAEVLTDEERKI